MKMSGRVVLIGLGGVGSHIAHPLAQFLQYKVPKASLILCDGDMYTAANMERQVVGVLGNKAQVTHDRLRTFGIEMPIDVKPKYVTEDNVYLFVRTGDIVVCCPDNHTTRKLLNDHCATLKDVVLVSGGNDIDNGNIQVYARKSGVDVTPPLTYLHPEIQHPQDKNPADMSCEELAQSSSPQLVVTNFALASHMLVAVYNAVHACTPISEAYFDLSTGAVRTARRTS
jgi:molybdopterin/thiamine biosynthesis adenylyltransferase